MNNLVKKPISARASRCLVPFLLAVLALVAGAVGRAQVPAAPPAAQAPTPPFGPPRVRPRVIVTTDGEINDRDSMIRFLLYANEFDVEALTYSSSRRFALDAADADGEACEVIVLTDAQWPKIEPLLPSLPRSCRGGRPWQSNRAVVDGILWFLKTGARGATCRRGTRVPRPAGAACAAGTRAVPGSGSGGRSSPSSTRTAGSVLGSTSAGRASGTVAMKYSFGTDVARALATR